MRWPVVAAIGLLACNEGPAGPPGPQGEQGPPGNAAELAALASRVVALEMMAAARKQPHLVAYAGTPNEIDLGPFIDWEHAWSEELGAYYSLAVATVYWEAAGCTGAAWAAPPAIPMGYLRSTAGTIVRVEPGDIADVTAASTMIDGRCERADVTVRGRPFSDTGIAPPITGQIGALDLTAQLH